MKKSTFPISLIVLFLFVQCKEKATEIQIQEPDPPSYQELCQPSVTTTHEFLDIVPDETMLDNKIKVSLRLPSCYKLTGLTGLDAKYGIFIIPDLNVILSFGIGQPVGTHGLNASSTKTEEIINGRKLWYEERNNQIYFSFPSAGPASFVSSNVEYKEEFLGFLRALTVRSQ